VRDRRKPAGLYGPIYWIFAVLCGLGGAGIIALAFESGAVILQAFGGIGLRNALPFIEPQLQQLVAWLLLLAAAVVASVFLNRKYGRGTRPSMPGTARPRARSAGSGAELSPDSAG